MPDIALAWGSNTLAFAVVTFSVAPVIPRLAVPLAGIAAAFVTDGTPPGSCRPSVQMSGNCKVANRQLSLV